MTDQEEYEALEHLMKSLSHAKKAEAGFEDGSRGESVSNNVVRWAEKSVGLAEDYVKEDNDD